MGFDAEAEDFLASIWAYAVITTVLSVYGIIVLSDDTPIRKIFNAGLYTMGWTMFLNILNGMKKK